ncbi:hypothetical protein FLX27_23465 [Agrobacterium tumefaciens]|nr:hypothetical protein [Agrobacterium tumefaciens]TQN59141.1 hypothetical protein FLX27_23465 [Agrobacterium tumefaciens]
MLAEAAARERKCKANDPKTILDKMRWSEAVKLKKLSEGKAPYSDLFAMPHIYFIDRVTPDDYKKNPMVPLLMSFGEYQIAHQRRAVLEKIEGQKSA